MFRLGPQELLIIFGIIVVIFGGKRFAELGKNLGSGIRNFKIAFKEVGRDDDESA